MRRNHWLAIASIAGLFVVIAGSLWFLFLGPAIAQARVATGYVAKTVCSCLFVDTETLAECKADAAVDRGPQISRVDVHADNAKKTVRAAFSLLSSDTAFYEEGYGCRLK